MDPIRAVGCWPTDPDATLPKRDRRRPLTLEEMLDSIPTDAELSAELERQERDAESLIVGLSEDMPG
jgi:hypothetical protein